MTLKINLRRHILPQHTMKASAAKYGLSATLVAFTEHGINSFGQSILDNHYVEDIVDEITRKHGNLFTA